MSRQLATRRRRAPRRSPALEALEARQLLTGPTLRVYDANLGVVPAPGAAQRYGSGWAMDLRAQAAGGTATAYSWDLSNAPGAYEVTGQDADRLQFSFYGGTYSGPGTIRLTVDFAGGARVTQELPYVLDGSDSPAWQPAPVSAASWPTVVTPDALAADQEAVGSGAYRVSLASGAVVTAHALAGAAAGGPLAGLVYASTTADARPILLERYTLDPARPLPALVSAKATLAGVPGPEVYYATAGLNPGAVVQLALPADATTLATGRYDYRVDVTAHYAVPETVTQSGRLSVRNDASGPLGAGWSWAGVDRLYPAADGVLVAEGADRAVWFAADGSGGYVAPAGEFSTLERAPDGTYTRTLPDGTRRRFDAAGVQVAALDRNGDATTYSYAGGRLAGVVAPNGQAVTIGYDGSGRLATIADWAGRVTYVGRDGAGRLASIADPGGATWGYAYDTAGRLATLTDPRGKATTFTLDATGRATGLVRPDYAVEAIAAAQSRGLAPAGTGTPQAPAPLTALVDAVATYRDAAGATWTTRLDPAGFGRAVERVDPLGDRADTLRDAAGLPWLALDPERRRSTCQYDARGNLVRHVRPDDRVLQDAYNGFGQVTQHTSPLGRITTYAYDARGNLLSVTRPDPDGAGPLVAPVTTYTYHPGTDLLASVTDATNRTTSYAYDALQRLVGATDPLNNTTGFGYDAANNLTRVTDARGYATTYAYDLLGRRTGEVRPDEDLDPANNPTYAYSYDAAGNLTGVTDPLGHATSYAYDALGRRETATDPLGYVTRYSYDATGNPTRVVDPMGYARDYGYDAAGRLVRATEPYVLPQGGSAAAAAMTALADPPATTFAYNAAGEGVGIAYPTGGEMAFTRDALGRVDRTYSPVADQGWTQASYCPDVCECPRVLYRTICGQCLVLIYSKRLDRLGRVTEFTDSDGMITRTAYDGADRVTSVTDPAGGVTSYTYDGAGRPEGVVEPTGTWTTFGYDAAGNRTSETVAVPTAGGGAALASASASSSGRTTLRTYDAQGRLRTVTDPEGGVTTYAYDRAGRLASLTDPVGNVTSYAYDAADRVTAVTDPRGAVTTYTRDANGRVTTATDRNGRVRTYAYDPAGRVTAEAWLDGLGGTLRTIASTYDAGGRLVAESDPDATYTYTYDAADRVTSADTLGTPGLPRTVLTSSYTASFPGNYVPDHGPRTVLTDNFGGTLRYRYENDARLAGIDLTVGGDRSWVDLGYDAAGRRNLITRGVEASWGGSWTAATTTLAYDAGNRVTAQSTTSPQHGALASFGYAYDGYGRLASSTGPEGTLTYSYDDTDQLTGVGGARAESYSYDANGNRTMAGWGVGTGNRLTTDGVHDYTHDAEGNLVLRVRRSDGRRTEYEWDHRNRLTRVVVRLAGGTVVAESRYTYDAQDRRIGSWSDADGSGPQAPVQRWTAYDGENPYIDFDGAGQVVARYLNGPGMDERYARVEAKPQGYYEPANQPTWYITDRLGTVRQLVDYTGLALDELAYDAYGNLLAETNPAAGDRFKFTGREWDAAVGLQYNRARHYDPSTGRWLSQDPIGFAAGDANLYRYVGNRATNAFDPSGLQDPTLNDPTFGPINGPGSLTPGRMPPYFPGGPLGPPVGLPPVPVVVSIGVPGGALDPATYAYYINALQSDDSFALSKQSPNWDELIKWISQLNVGPIDQFIMNGHGVNACYFPFSMNDLKNPQSKPYKFLQALGAKMSQKGEIEIKACCVAGGEGGPEYIRQMAKITGHPVSAYTDWYAIFPHGDRLTACPDGRVNVTGSYPYYNSGTKQDIQRPGVPPNLFPVKK